MPFRVVMYTTYLLDFKKQKRLNWEALYFHFNWESPLKFYECLDDHSKRNVSGNEDFCCRIWPRPAGVFAIFFYLFRGISKWVCDTVRGSRDRHRCQRYSDDSLSAGWAFVLHVAAQELKHISSEQDDRHCMYVLMDVWGLAVDVFVCMIFTLVTFKVSLWSSIYIFIYVSRCVLFLNIVFILMYYVSVDCHSSRPKRALRFFYSVIFFQPSYFSLFFCLFFPLTWGISVVHCDSDPSLVARRHNLAFSCFLCLIFRVVRATCCCLLVTYTPRGEVSVALVKQRW